MTLEEDARFIKHWGESVQRCFNIALPGLYGYLSAQEAVLVELSGCGNDRLLEWILRRSMDDVVDWVNRRKIGTQKLSKQKPCIPF